MPSSEEIEDAGILEASGLTEADRRNIRKQQRELFKDLEEKETLEVGEARDRNNEIYRKVRYTREAVLDGENLTLIANKAAQHVDRLIQVPRYDADRLVSKLVKKCRSSTSSQGGAFFDWKTLGVEAGVCFNAIPSGVCFLNGPLMDGQPLQVKQRAQRQRVVDSDEDAKEERPENVQGHTTKDADQLSAIEKSMKDLQHSLKKKVDKRYLDNKKRLQEAHDGDIPGPLKKKLKKYGVEICAIQFLFNPESFTQTVENIFQYSFLIKKGSASIAVRDKTFQDAALFGGTNLAGPVVKYTNENKTNARPSARQTIMTLTMKDWKDLCQAYNVTKGDLPHRTGSKHAKREQRAGLSQSQSLSQAST